MNKFHIGAAAMTLLLAGCGVFGGQEDAETPAAAAIDEIVTASHRNAAVATNDNVITVRRNGEGEQGVAIRRAPIMVHFTVQGEGAMLRASVAGRTGDLPLAENNSIMVGPGGTSNLIVYSTTGAELVVTVIGVSPCDAANPCQPPEISPAPTEAAPEGLRE